MKEWSINKFMEKAVAKSLPLVLKYSAKSLFFKRLHQTDENLKQQTLLPFIGHMLPLFQSWWSRIPHIAEIATVAKSCLILWEMLISGLFLIHSYLNIVFLHKTDTLHIPTDSCLNRNFPNMTAPLPFFWYVWRIIVLRQSFCQCVRIYLPKRRQILKDNFPFVKIKPGFRIKSHWLILIFAYQIIPIQQLALLPSQFFLI